MPRKQSKRPRPKRRSTTTRSRATETRYRASETRGAETQPEPVEEDELTSQVVRGCLIARDSVFNVRDFLAEGSRLAFLAIKDCEKELDQIERKIDEQLPEAITRVGEAKARELLACLKFITDLERIGDLAYSAVMHLQSRREKLPAADSRQLVEMASLLHTMLEQIHQGFRQTRCLLCAKRTAVRSRSRSVVPRAVSAASGRAQQSERTKEFRYPSRRAGARAHRRSFQEFGRRTL